MLIFKHNICWLFNMRYKKRINEFTKFDNERRIVIVIHQLMGWIWPWKVPSMLCLAIVLYPLAHILSLVPKPGSCQISRNRLICVFGVRDSGKITYSVVTWDRMPQIIHTRYQNDRGKMTIILVYHNMALRVCRAHHLRKCEILGPISCLFFILLSH